jgi:hypothetical protein
MFHYIGRRQKLDTPLTMMGIKVNFANVVQLDKEENQN